MEEFSGTDRYAVERRLGAGGFGVVYQVHDRHRDERVALKTLHRLDAQALYRLKKEFRSLANVRHPNLVSLYDLMSDGDQWFFTMELIHGVDILTYLRCGPGPDPSAVTRDGDLTPEPVEDGLRLRDALKQLASGVLALHRGGILHRDIKPSNVLVSQEGRVALLDFGLAKDIVRDQSTDDGVIGTPAYMAPEQALGKQVTEATDWYSVGVMLFEMLTGCLPYHGTPMEVLLAKQNMDPLPPGEYVKTAPLDLCELCMRLLARDASDRPGGEAVLRFFDSAAEIAPAPLPRATEDAAFFGRAEELAVLADAFRATQQGQTVSVLISGQPGIGKSALLDRFIGTLDPGQAVVLRGRCYERESVPYKAVDGLIDALSRHLRRIDRAEAAALMPREAGALARLFPVLQRVEAVREAPVPPHSMALEDQELRRRGFLALRELLTRLADRSRLVLALDDLQWGDVDSAALLADLLRPPEPPQLLLVGCFRSEQVAASAFLRAFLAEKQHLGTLVRELEVGPLAVADAESLACFSVGGDGFGEVVASIARESAGHPLFILELARYLQTSQSSLDSDLRLEEVLTRRIHQLPDDARRLLEVIALAAQPIGEKAAGDAAGLASSARGSLEELWAQQLIRRSVSGEEQVETYHDRIRETVMASLDPASARQHHLQIAQTLEASETADPEVLAIHFFEAGVADRACTYAIEAADQAARALAFDRAAALYQRAIDLDVLSVEQARSTKEKMGHALANAGRGGEAAEVFLQAAEGADDACAVDLRRLASIQRLLSGRIDQGMEVLETFLPAYGYTPRGPRRALLSLMWARARLRTRGVGYTLRDSAEIPRHLLDQLDVLIQLATCFQIVDTVQGAALATHVIRRALDLGEPSFVAYALGGEAMLHGFAGPDSQHRADAMLARARACADQIDQPFINGFLALCAGVVAHMGKGRFREGLALFDEAAGILGEIPGTTFLCSAAQFLAVETLYYLGEMAELSRRVPQMLQDARRRGDIWLQVATAAAYGHFFWLAADRPAELQTVLDETMSRWAQGGFKVGHYFAEVARTNRELYSGDAQAALERIERHWAQMYRAAQFWQEGRVVCWFWMGRASLAVAHQRQGQATNPLLKKVRRCVRKLEREGVNFALVFAGLLRAGIAAVTGDQQSAVRALADAEQQASAHDMALYAACARRRRGPLIGGDEGQQLVRSAEAFMSEQQIKRPDRMTALLVPGFSD